MKIDDLKGDLSKGIGKWDRERKEVNRGYGPVSEGENWDTLLMENSRGQSRQKMPQSWSNWEVRKFGCLSSKSQPLVWPLWRKTLLAWYKKKPSGVQLQRLTVGYCRHVLKWWVMGNVERTNSFFYNGAIKNSKTCIFSKRLMGSRNNPMYIRGMKETMKRHSHM